MYKRQVQHHPAIGRTDAGFLTDFIGLEAEEFAHHEYPGGLRRKVVEAGFENFPELLLLEGGLGVGPASRLCRILPVAAPVEQGIVEQIIAGFVSGQRACGNLAALAADDVDDLVAQDGDCLLYTSRCV